MAEMIFNGFGHGFGNFKTRTLGDVYLTPHDTREEAQGKIGSEYFEYYYENTGMEDRLLTDTTYNLNTIYTLLMAKYANNHIKSSDENRFKLQVAAIIWEYGPEWQRDMQIADKKLRFTDEELREGSFTIYNHAEHPDTQPDDASLTELEYISDQNTTRYSTSITGGVSRYYELDKANNTSKFLNRFKDLFITICYPAETLLYLSED